MAEFGGEGNFDFILEEVAKIKAARQVSYDEEFRVNLTDGDSGADAGLTGDQLKKR